MDDPTYWYFSNQGKPPENVLQVHPWLALCNYIQYSNKPAICGYGEGEANKHCLGWLFSLLSMDVGRFYIYHDWHH